MKPSDSQTTFNSHLSNGVSIILPVLNEEFYLAHAVNAILSQDFTGPMEVILAIGPSKDRTQIIAEELRTEDARVVLVVNPSGRTAMGLNLAIRESRYPVIVRVDGHAEIPENYISLAVEILNRTGAVNVGGVATGVTDGAATDDEFTGGVIGAIGVIAGCNVFTSMAVTTIVAKQRIQLTK